MKLEQSEILELSEYLQMPIDNCIEIYLAVSSLIQEEYRKINPKSLEEIINFYRNSDYYMFELVSEFIKKYKNNNLEPIILSACRLYPVNKILDFFTSIGQNLKVLKNSNYKLFVTDVQGKTFDFVKWRCKEINFTILEFEYQKDYLKDHMFDCIFWTRQKIIFNPIETFEYLDKHLLPGGILFLFNNFEKPPVFYFQLNPKNIKILLSFIESKRYRILLDYKNKLYVLKKDYDFIKIN